MDLELRAVMVERNAGEWSTLLAADPDPYHETCYPPDGSRTRPRQHPPAQALHHGTDHRSRSTGLTALGVEPPFIDVDWRAGRRRDNRAGPGRHPQAGEATPDRSVAPSDVARFRPPLVDVQSAQPHQRREIIRLQHECAGESLFRPGGIPPEGDMVRGALVQVSLGRSAVGAGVGLLCRAHLVDEHVETRGDGARPFDPPELAA